MKRKAARRRGGDSEPAVTFADILRAKESRAPDFVDLVCSYVEQRDPAQNRPEEPSEKEFPDLPDDAWTIGKLRNAVAERNMYGKTADEAWSTRRAAWQSLMAAPHPPPRLKLGDLMIELYETGDPWSRRMLVGIFGKAKLGWGLWRGFKSIYKLAEEKHDAEMLGVIGCRCDIFHSTRNSGEIGPGTVKYMRRRAWRYLRQLGNALPELFPTYACQVLRHYPRGMSFYGTWVASHIWAHDTMVGETNGAWFDGPPDELKGRAYDESWKLSADPLLRLLEDAHNDTVCKFAIRSLEADFTERLRQLKPDWLARIAGKRLSTVDTFVVKLLEGNPDFHQSKLKKLGLEPMVLGLLHSDSDEAVRYAIDYCNAHSPTIEVDTLIDLAERNRKELTDFVVARVEKLTPRALGVIRLVRMLGISVLKTLAEKKLKDGFSPNDIDEPTYVALATGDRSQQKFLSSFFSDAKKAVPTNYLRAHAEVPGLSRRDLRGVMGELGKRSGTEIGVDWIKSGLFDKRFTSFVSDWLSRGILKGDDLDVDWLKSLVARPSWRRLALGLLGNTEYVAPHRIGSDWLLRAARHSDSTVAEFAYRYLLHHFSPSDFERERGDGTNGVDIVFELFSDEHPSSVRRFAASYLLLHHPELSKSMEEFRALGIKPKLKLPDYSAARLRPLLFDGRTDVRTFAAKVARAEIVRWNDSGLAYEMASSNLREPRIVGAEAVLGIGEEKGEGTIAPPIEWLDGDRAFAMAESSTKATREIALTMIRRHYAAIGDPHKLAWLMDSPDREVRLFSVRLLWDQHRPVVGPARSSDSAGNDGESRRFDSVATLREFVRVVMFGLPPGRMERRDGAAGAASAAERPYPASVAKRRVVDVVRQMATETSSKRKLAESAEFAAVVAPVLEEFLASRAKGEWHACVSALAQMRAVHPTLETSLPNSVSLPSSLPTSHGPS